MSEHLLPAGVDVPASPSADVVPGIPVEDPATVTPAPSRAELRRQAQEPVLVARPRGGLRARSDRLATWLLVAAASCVLLGGVALALGLTRPHTLLVYAAVGLGGLGVLLALPKALSSVPFDPTAPMPRRRSDD